MTGNRGSFGGRNWKKRHLIDIYADILEISRNGALKTHIVGKANLNFSIVDRYLSKLIDMGLIEVDLLPFTCRYIYKTTERGIKFLEKYHELLEMLKCRRVRKFRKLEEDLNLII